MKISFSGHETFVCRQFWLKKGFEHLLAQRSFNDDDAVVHLGVGKNMTTSIKFWLKGFSIITNEDLPTLFGSYLFDGKDPYLEDTASLWLLHYSIVKNERVFIFNSFFNHFLKEKNEFTKSHLISFLKRKTEEAGLKHFSEKTYDSDSNVFLRTYNRANDGKSDLEDETSNLLVELNLIRPFTRIALDGKTSVQWFRVMREGGNTIPKEILTYAILDTYGENVQSLSFKDLLEGVNSPGNIFSLTEKGLEDILTELSQIWPNEFGFDQTAGNRVLHVKRQMNKWEVLDKYYD